MPTFEVWRGDDWGDTRDDARKVAALDAKTAAERACQVKFSDWDYPSFIDGLRVAEVGSDVVQRFDVTVKVVFEFTATPARPHGSEGR
jgi:hypothetical protein